MGESDKLKLFKDFCTLKSNSHLNPNGVGLGLSICKKICTALEGNITCTSKLGQGSTFTFFVECDLLNSLTYAIKMSTGTASGSTPVNVTEIRH